MIIVIKGKKYPLKTIEAVDLIDLLDLQAETKAMGRELTLAAIQDMERDIQKIKHKDPDTQGDLRGRHPDALWLMGLTLWSTRRCAGEDITFREAMKTSRADITYVAEADDPKMAADPRSARPGSGRATKRAPKARATRKTSAQR